MVSAPQSRNRLEDRGGKNDEMSRRMWKTVEAKAGSNIKIASSEL